jgi:hypothetical protein
MNATKHTLYRLASRLRLPLAALTLLLTVNCSTDNTGVIDTTNTDFNKLYNETVALPGHQNTVDFGYGIHEYYFTFSETKTIASIGYQSQPAATDVPYSIKIINNTTNKLLYYKSHIFASDTTSYIPIDPPVVVKKGESYTIRRTLVLANVGNLNANLTGRVVTQSGGPIEFPKTSGLMTITGSKFYLNGGTFVNAGIPYIDIAYY